MIEPEYVLGEEESYWRAVLAEGEFAPTVPPEALAEWQAVATVPRATSGTNPPSAVPPDEMWQTAQQFYESGSVSTAQVVGYNRGGVLVEWQDLRGFVPASHLVGLSPVMDDEARKNEFARRIGWSLCVKVI